MAPAHALGYVAEELPGLDRAATAAFALVALVGRPRPEVASSPDADAAADLSPEALAEALARARKALRRKLHPLPGSGWCERAERLISDRLDEALVDPGPARLEVHLANCERCAEHERRLNQAQDALAAGFEKAHPPEQPAREAPIAPDESDLPRALRVVDAPAPLPQAEPIAVKRAADVIEVPAASAPEPVSAPTPAAPPAEPSSPGPVSAAPPAVSPPQPASVPRAPVRPAHWTAPAPAAPTRPAHWTAPAAPAPAESAAPAEAPRPYWPSSPRTYEATGWHGAPALETRAARSAIEDDEWTSLGPLLAVLFATIAVLATAGLLAI